MKRFLTALGLILAAAATALGAIQGKTVEYRAGDTTMKGYLAYDDGVQGRRPGVLVVHEWWGLNEYARERARMLAGLGYTALAIDMYGGGKQAGHPDEAGKFAAAVQKNLPLARERFLAAMELLKRQPTVDPEKIAAVGYCFGGGIVLAMARSGIDLDGVVSFHGTLATDAPARPGEVRARILVLNGADDPFVTGEQIATFKKEMAKAGADYRLVNYPGAKHSFTNPRADELGKKFNLPLAYSPEADAKSWQAMQDFLKRIFDDGGKGGKTPGH